jgi:16S rRNA (cytosine1402-N4)-methyltransferase
MVAYHQHLPVLLNETIAALAVRAEGCYVDGTFGRGGHAAELLERLGADGRLYALDKDAMAVEFGRQRFSSDERVTIEQGSFAQLEDFAERHGITGRVDGLLLDLGVSSPQLDDPQRGFSFSQDGPLDMRMDATRGPSAADWLAEVDEATLARIFKEYGEERFARRIARAIVADRRERPFRTTAQLAGLIARVSPSREPGKHPATRCFQAIRIFVNNELEDLKSALVQSLRILAVGARLAVISFHSLEDRIVKRFLRDAAYGERFPKGLPVPDSVRHPKLRLLGKAIRPKDTELAENPRARSAVLRVAEVLR